VTRPNQGLSSLALGGGERETLGTRLAKKRAHVTRPLGLVYNLTSVRFKMAARSVEFWPSLERNFSGIGCTVEANTTVSSST